MEMWLLWWMETTEVWKRKKEMRESEKIGFKW